MDYPGHNESATPPPLNWYPPHQNREDEPEDFSTPPMSPSTPPRQLTMPSPILTHSPELSQSTPGTPDAGGPSSYVESPVTTRISMPMPMGMPPLPELENTAGPSRRPTLTPASERPPLETYGPPYLSPRPLPQHPSRERLGRTHSSGGHGTRYENVSTSGNGNGMGTTITHPVRALSYSDGRYGRMPRERPVSAMNGERRTSGLDYIVPEALDPEKKMSEAGVSYNSARDKKVKERLEPTKIHAQEALAKASRQARMTGYALNVCIGIQILLGALTTGIAASVSGRRTSIVIAILGGTSTLAASYLARARGSGEPEQSVIRCSELEHFLRDLEAFMLDAEAEANIGQNYDREVQRFRKRFEEILGNNQDQQAAKYVPKDMMVQERPGGYMQDNIMQGDVIQEKHGGYRHGNAFNVV